MEEHDQLNLLHAMHANDRSKWVLIGNKMGAFQLPLTPPYMHRTHRSIKQRCQEQMEREEIACPRATG